MKNNVILFVNESRLAEQLSRIESGCYHLQEIYDGLIGLGAEADQITVDDLKNLMISDGSPAEIKRIVLRGKVLQVAGMMIAKESIHFDEKALRDLSRICRNAPSYLEQGNCYEIVNGKIKCLDSLEDDLRASHTLYGSVRQKEIADKMTALATQIESLRKEIGATHPYHPLRNPDTWFESDSRGQYVPNIYRIAKNVAP